MSTIVVTLGDFVFQDFEMPETLPFGGEQSIVMQKLVGGKRVLNAMGRDDRALTWSGTFLGINAISRARNIDAKRVAGKTLTFSWSEFRYSVLIKGFHPDFRRSYEIPFNIELEVIEDLGRPVGPPAPDSVDQAISKDNVAADALVAQVNDAPLTGLMATLDTAISSVSSFAAAAQSTINSVLQPLADVQARVKLLTSSVGNTITNVATLGGVVPNSPVAAMASKLTGQMVAMQQLPVLYNLQNVLGRMGGNLGSIGTSGEQRSVAGGNLFQLASEKYGDASDWTTIANANGLSDPQVTGVRTLTIPANADGSGGVLTA